MIPGNCPNNEPWLGNKGAVPTLKREDYSQFLPSHPLAGDGYDNLHRHQERKAALEHSVIQINRADIKLCIGIDIDHRDAFWRIEESGVEKPNILSYNPAKGHANVIYILETPVGFSGRSKEKPKRYYDMAVRGLTRRLGGDWNYTGTFIKNPYHHGRMLDFGRDQPYSLDELMDCLSDSDIQFKPKQEEWGYGRNVTLFNTVRLMAYSEVLNIKKRGGVFDEFHAWVDEKAWAANQEFGNPLYRSEVRATVNSISEWTWEKYSPVWKISAARRSARKRWDAVNGAEVGKPWLKEGCSRATYYRRRTTLSD